MTAEFLKKNDLPDDPRILDRLLMHPDEDILEKALKRLEELGLLKLEYGGLTVVDLEPNDSGVTVVMTVEAMHDDVWTQRLLAGRANELDNLAAVVERRRAAS